MLEVNPNLTPARIRDILQRTATPLPAYYPYEVGAGMLNAQAAVLEAAFPQRHFGRWRGSAYQRQVQFTTSAPQNFNGSVTPGNSTDSSLNIPAGTLLASDSVRSTVGVGAAVAALRTLNGSDVTFVQGVDVASAGTTDTTYVSISGDRRWIAFGEGNTAGAGTIFMAGNNFFSPPITQTDLTNNAAERVNGIALDSTGVTMAAHGDESFFAAVDVPFHLRLQGKYKSFGNGGAGIVFHPRAKGITSPDQFRTAFVASSAQAVEIVDIFHYINRGRLDLKSNLYGPLRATLPLPGDSPDIILKLFGVTPDGLVVIDLRAEDIKPLP